MHPNNVFPNSDPNFATLPPLPSLFLSPVSHLRSHFAEAEAKLEKARIMNQRVEEAQMRRGGSSDVSSRDAIKQKLIDAENRRIAIQEESKAKASTPSKAEEVRQKRDKEAAEASVQLKLRQTAADERHSAAVAESKERGAAVVRKAMGVSASQQDREWVAREDLAAGIASKLREAEQRRMACLDSSKSGSTPSSTPAKSSSPLSSPGSTGVPFNTPVSTQTGI